MRSSIDFLCTKIMSEKKKNVVGVHLNGPGHLLENMKIIEKVLNMEQGIIFKGSFCRKMKIYGNVELCLQQLLFGPKVSVLLPVTFPAFILTQPVYCDSP